MYGSYKIYYETNKFVAETEVHYAENNALN